MLFRPALAKKLVFEEGVRTIEDLKEKNIKLTHHQQIGLKYFDDFETRVPREEIKKLKVPKQIHATNIFFFL